MSDIYLSLDASNPRDSGTYYDAKIQYSSTSAVLQNPAEYKGTVLRLSIPFMDIPIFLFDGDDTKSNYKVTIRFGGVDYTQDVLFIPEFSSDPITDQLYYGVYTYTHMLLLVNTAINTAWIAAGSPQEYHPWFGFGSDSEIFSFYYPQSWISGTAQFFMNEKLFQFFASFDVEFLSYSAVKGVRFTFDRLYNSNGANMILPANIQYPSGSVPTLPVWYSRGDWSTISQWYQFDKILLTCADMPSVQEFNSPLSLNNNSSNDITLPILTDFIVDLDEPGRSLRSYVQYSPSAEFRWFDLISNRPLTSMTFEFYALLKSSVNNTTNLYKIPISPNQTIHMKLLFRRKDNF